MRMILDDNKLIYIQIADTILDDILKGTIKEEEQVYSTNQFAKLYGINPATAAKGINLLVDEGILYKKRGIGMFVVTGAKGMIIEKRRKEFIDEYVSKIVNEAKKLNITKEELINLICKYEGGDKR